MSETQKRVGSLRDLPDESLRCKAFGHQWSEPGAKPAGRGWPKCWSIVLGCPCGRWRKDIVSDSGEVVSREYGGGVMLLDGADGGQREARLTWLGRVRERAQVTSIRRRRRSA